MLDITQFISNVQINVIDRVIEIEGSHDTMKDKLGQISRWMKRKYKIPPDVKLDTLTTLIRNNETLILNAERNLVRT